jgi:osmotically-inducible protein OsmY
MARVIESFDQFSQPNILILTPEGKLFMKKSPGIVSGLALTLVFTLGALGQTPAMKMNKNTPPKTTQSKPTKPAKNAAAKSDSDIQACVESKIAADPKLKDQGFVVSVSNGVATFSGSTKNSGSKSGVANLAKSCGSKQVVNNITVEKAAKSSSTGAAKHAVKPKK